MRVQRDLESLQTTAPGAATLVWSELLLYFLDSEDRMDSFYIRMSKHRKVCV